MRFINKVEKDKNQYNVKSKFFCFILLIASLANSIAIHQRLTVKLGD